MPFALPLSGSLAPHPHSPSAFVAHLRFYTTLIGWAALLVGCTRSSASPSPESASAPQEREPHAFDSTQSNNATRFLDPPLIRTPYSADPSAHAFGDRLYVYPSHDIDTNIPADDLGSHFAMRDYHVFSMSEVGGAVTDHGVVLDIAQVPWATRQMWAPDAAEKDGSYYLYFPAKDKNDIFRLGVAKSSRPEGPFQAEPKPIAGSFSIDPAVFRDSDGSFYLYFGGIWGGQLQRFKSGQYLAGDDAQPAPHDPALTPKMARLSENMLQFAEAVKDVLILDENGQALKAGDSNRRFFEAAFLHKYDETYYLSYSTGDTHFIVYATGTSPYGPFTYRGRLLEPVLGWTTHHSIVQYRSKWYLFYHDCELSGGQTHLRNVKVTELRHQPDGSISAIDPYFD